MANFVWGDSDDICDLKWSIKCPGNFQQPPWILPSSAQLIQVIPDNNGQQLVHEFPASLKQHRTVAVDDGPGDVELFPRGYGHVLVLQNNGNENGVGGSSAS